MNCSSETSAELRIGFEIAPTCGIDSSTVGNVLVVSTVDHPEDVLRSYVGEADKLKVVVPVVRQGFLDWLANDEKAFSSRAERRGRHGCAVTW